MADKEIGHRPDPTTDPPDFGVRSDPPPGARPARDTGMPTNGRHSPAEGLRGRVTHLQPELGVQITNGEGDNLRQISYKTPEPIPRADPEGRGRTIGQRVDEMIAEAESRAVRDYQKALEERGP